MQAEGGKLCRRDSRRGRQRRPERIGQVLTNSLDNALRNTPLGGRITVTVDNTSEGARFTVTDTGARAIVTMHKGRITAASDGPGTGATLTVVLPDADESGGKARL